MLYDKDIQKIIEVFTTRDELKELLSNLVTKEEFSDLQTSVGAYAQKADAYFQEMVMLAHKVDRHEKWFHLIAEKLGIKLEY